MKLGVLLVAAALLLLGAAGTIHAQTVYPGPASASDSVSACAGQDVTLASNPDPTNPLTIVTVTIPGDEIGGCGTVTLQTSLNGDGSVSAVVTGPAGETGTVCVGVTSCMEITFDDTGTAFFTLFPPLSANLPPAVESLPEA